MSEIIKQFGNPTKEDQKNYTYQCPYCHIEGRDNSCDNMKIKKTTGLITCFKSKDHTQKLRVDFKSNVKMYKNIQRKTTEIDFNEDKIKENMKYLEKCQRHLNDDYNTLISHRGLKVSTLKELRVGIDPEKACWVFPVFHYPSGKLIGFEYRDIKMLPRKEGGGIWHSEGTFSCLAQVNTKPPRVDYVIITEGFIDAFCLYQYIQEKNIIPCHILTPSCGVYSIVNNINTIRKKSILGLIIDNDKAGNEVFEELIQKSKQGFINCLVPNKYKDFQEYYVNELKNSGTI